MNKTLAALTMSLLMATAALQADHHKKDEDAKKADRSTKTSIAKDSTESQDKSSKDKSKAQDAQSSSDKAEKVAVRDRESDSSSSSAAAKPAQDKEKSSKTAAAEKSKDSKMAKEEPLSQRGSTLIGCLEETGMGYVLTDGTVDGAMVFGKDDVLKKHIDHWVKLDGESFRAGGVEHFRARTVTHISASCDEGVEKTMQAQATATLKDVDGKTVGEAKLMQAVHGVLVRIDIQNLPAGRHALHIHETGKCEGPAFKSAGGHYDPKDVSHGFLSGKSHHAGDMPNFDVPDSGKVRVEVINPMISLSESRSTTVFDEDGSALLVHRGADDYKSQPSGSAGDPLACGVIKKTTQQ